MVLSIPNFFGIPFASYFISKIGLGWGILFYASFTAVGITLFYLGIVLSSYGLLLFGFAIFGFALDNVTNI
jgi:Major Facilitator Superfamily